MSSGIDLDSSGNLIAGNYNDNLGGFGSLVSISSTRQYIISGTYAIWGVAVANDGYIYATDHSLKKFYKISPTGTMLELASFSSSYSSIGGVSRGPGDSLYFSLGGTIYKYSESTGVSVFSTVPGGIFDICYGYDDHFYVTSNNSIYKVDATTGSYTTLASGLVSPTGLDIDESGNVYVALDSSSVPNDQLAKVTQSGEVTIIATGVKNPTFVLYVVPEPNSFKFIVLALFLFLYRFKAHMITPKNSV